MVASFTLLTARSSRKLRVPTSCMCWQRLDLFGARSTSYPISLLQCMRALQR